MKTESRLRRSVINLGGPDHLSASFNPSLFPSISWTLQGVWVEPAHPLPNILMRFMQSNCLIKSTLMFNVLPGTEISVHAEFSHCRQNWYYGLQATYSSMALKVGGPCTFGPLHCQTLGIRTPEVQNPHRNDATADCWKSFTWIQT